MSGEHCGTTDACDSGETHDDYAFLRLVKLSSDVLPTRKTVAIVDGRHGGVSIGRDKSFTSRLRLPSMEVSKHHANLFSTSRSPIRFSVADTGSMHGTYVCRRGCPTSADSLAAIPSTSFERLSPAKHASQPYTLEHYDLLRIGVQSTVFEVHLHPHAWDVCEKCAVQTDGANEISLAPLAGAKRVQREAEQDVGERDSRKRLKALKHMFLPRPDVIDSQQQEQQEQLSKTYRDRAALRRSLYPTEPRPESTAPATSANEDGASAAQNEHVGYRMFSQMARDAADAPLLQQAPVVPRVVQGRAGLGSTGLVDAETFGSYSGQGHASARHQWKKASAFKPSSSSSFS